MNIFAQIFCIEIVSRNSLPEVLRLCSRYQVVFKEIESVHK